MNVNESIIMSFEDRLIDCVKEREAIWNVKSKSYRILSQKEEKWKEIARELNTTGK